MCWGGVIWGDGVGSLSACWPSSLEHLPLRLEQMRRRGGGGKATPGVRVSCQVVAGRFPRSQLNRCGFQILVKSSDFLC